MTTSNHSGEGPTPRPSLEQRVRLAILALESTLAEAEGAGEIAGGQRPPEAAAAAFRAAAAACADRLDAGALLLHALELPRLAQTAAPVGGVDESTCSATCLLRENLTQYLTDELARYWNGGRGGAASQVVPAASPVPIPTGHLELARLEAKADGLFDAWIAGWLEEDGRPPEEYDALGELKELADQVLPDEAATASLLLLALEHRAVHTLHPDAGSLGQALLPLLAREAGVNRPPLADSFESRPLADARPPNYECLLEQHAAGELALSPASLIWENLYLQFVDYLEIRWQAWLTSYWTEQPDGCAFCRAERGEWCWQPFAGLPFLFVPAPAGADEARDGAGEHVLRIGPNCKALLDSGGTLTFWFRARQYQVSVACGVAPLGELP